MPSPQHLANFSRSLSRRLMRIAVKAARYGYKHGAAGFLRRINFEFQQRYHRHDYEAWMKRQDDCPSLESSHAALAASAYQPLMSFITPVFETAPTVLADMLESVRAQSYPHWEICLAVGGASHPGIRGVLERYTARDPRIRVQYLTENRGISGNSNEALAMAQGEYIVLLDHDDLVAPELLAEAVSLLQEQPNADVIYYDEDKVSADGARRHSPYFKPHTWSPEYLLSENYLMHSIVRYRLAKDVGGFDSRMDGAQDWDLLFRCAERSEQIHHIPKVLYHGRQVPASTSTMATNKVGVTEAQIRSVAAHIRRTGIAGADVSLPPTGGRMRVQWNPAPAKVSIIIPSKDNAHVLRRCLISILNKTAYTDYEIIIVDSGSQEMETFALYRKMQDNPRVRVIPFEKPFNYSAANNFGACHADGDILLFLNNDMEVLEPDWLTEMVRWTERPGIGVVGAMLLFPNRTIQHAGVVMSLFGLCSHICLGAPENFFGCYGSVGAYRNFMAVTGACQMMRRAIFDEIGGYNEQYELVFSDVQICLDAVERGYRVMLTPFARLMHHEGKTRSGHIPTHDIAVAERTMSPALQRSDPYFNPNLSRWSHIPRVALHEDESRERLAA
jgi:GT2 family glycosyltransferase